MELTQLIDELSDGSVYPDAVDRVEVCQTHISVVFLAGAYAYKIKKPVDLGFLDFTTLDKRGHYCAEELRLNRRLAPNVYLGVVPVCCTADGVRVEGPGDLVEWAVKMERLAPEATFESRLERGEIDAEKLVALADRIAEFHAHAERGLHVASFGGFDMVARNTLENFEQSARQVGVTVSAAVFGRLRTLAEAALDRLRPIIQARARRGVPCDTHGDLHLDHVYLFPERPPPADLVIIDCIEFNARFRYADPVADMAFLVMDLAFHGRRDLAEVFAAAYFRACLDEEGRCLLSFYMSYRAAVRAKVEGLESIEKEVPEQASSAARTRARAHWLLALSELETPAHRPCLLLVAGLPGSGKSTLARLLGESANFCVIRSDVVRKELAEAAPIPSGRPDFDQGIYSPALTERTYAECLRRTEQLLCEGRRVVVDASFVAERHRQTFLNLAAELALPALMLRCQAAEEIVRGRLLARRGDASDADWWVHGQMAERWEEAGPHTRKALRDVETNAAPEQVLHAVLDLLRTSMLQGGINRSSADTPGSAHGRCG